MNTLELIRDTFHPEPYPVFESEVAGSVLHLSREGLGKCKYVLLVGEVNSATDIKARVRLQKEELKRYHHASVWRGVGVLELLIGKHADWEGKVHEVKPDWHGLQSVILQGLIFIDPETRRHSLTQSHWGPFKFGNFQGQMNRVHYLLGRMAS